LLTPNLENQTTINWDEKSVEVRSNESYEFNSDEDKNEGVDKIRAMLKDGISM